LTLDRLLVDDAAHQHAIDGICLRQLDHALFVGLRVAGQHDVQCVGVDASALQLLDPLIFQRGCGVRTRRYRDHERLTEWRGGSARVVPDLIHGRGAGASGQYRQAYADGQVQQCGSSRRATC
jgi:hypothetical protein